MSSPTYLVGFACGCTGGLFVEVLSLYKNRMLPRSQRPLHYNSVFFWFCTIAMVLCGGALVLLYIMSGISMTPILGANIGASAPLSIGAMAHRLPDISPGTTDI